MGRGDDGQDSAPGERSHHRRQSVRSHEANGLYMHISSAARCHDGDSFWAGYAGELENLSLEDLSVRSCLSFFSSQPEDAAYLKEVHAEALQYRGLSEKHFDIFIKHFEDTLKELGSIIPADKCKEAIANVKSTRVIFKKGK